MARAAGVFFLPAAWYLTRRAFSAYTMPMTMNGEIMLYRNALGEVLREQRLSQGMTLRTVAQASTLALGYLSEVERGQKEISSELLKALAAGLEIETQDLVIRAGLRMAGIQIPDTPESLYETIDEYADLG